MSTGTRRMRKLALAFVATFSISSGASALNVGLSASASGVGVGAIIDVTITASGLGAGTSPSLGSFDIDVAYDSAFFAFDPGSIAFGTGLGSVACASPAPGCEVLEESSVAPGLVDMGASSLILASLDASQPASFVLGSFRLVAIAEGATTLTFAQLVAGDTTTPIPAPFSGITSSTVTLTVLPTPEPSWWALFGPVGWFALRRRAG